jgi:hypothetical protein
MKILIFASPRSGSTELTYALAKLLKFKFSLEPFNPLNIKGLTEDQINNKGNNISNNKIVKVLSVHRPRKWYLNYISKFDKVIYLTRKNAKLAIESFQWAINNKELKNAKYPTVSKWHMSYTFNPLNITMDKWVVEHMTKCVEEVKAVAYLNKKSYILYEDLYSEDITVFNSIVDQIDLDLDKVKLRDMLHPSKKYRKPIKPKTII